MLSGVKQKTQHIRRQLRATDTAMFEQLITRGAAELIERALDVRDRIVNQIGHCSGWISRLGFHSDRLFLGIAQPFPPCVGEQAIECPSEVFDVEPDRRRATVAQPDVLGRNFQCYTLEVVASLDERMSDGHQHGVDSFDRSTHPSLWL